MEKEKYGLKDCLYWDSFILTPFFIALYAIWDISQLLAYFYIALFLISFFIVCYKFFCSHCPYYCDDSKTLKCMFLFNFPKFFKKNPKPLSFLDKTITIIAILLVFAFPLYWLAQKWLLFVAYCLSWIILGITLKKYECEKCAFTSCPFKKSS